MLTFSYYTFASYQPKSLRELPEVKGLDSTPDNYVPTPIDSYIVGSDLGSDVKTTVVKTSKPIMDIETFYYNISRIKKWNLEESFADDRGFTRVFKHRGNTLRINVTKSENPTDVFNYVSITVIES